MNKRISFLVCFLLVFLSCAVMWAGIDVLPLKKRAEVIDRWLKIRLHTILPQVMRREKIDMWIVICREYNEDPVFHGLVPANWFSARRTTMLIFYDRGKTKGLERLYVARCDVGDLYKGLWYPGKNDQWECLAQLIEERDPKRIGINRSHTFAFGDGLTSSLEEKLRRAIGPKYSARLCSAEKVAVGWLEKRSPEELAVYPQISAVAHEIIAEAFSNKVITPGITTTREVEWWIREKISSLGLQAWFPPDVDYQRPGTPAGMYSNSGVIERGDLLHCDVGITYLRLNTDTQEHAYVLRVGEETAPPALVAALKQGNRLQDILTAEFKHGRTGNEILRAALSKAETAGLKASIYTHPIALR
ncbi:MAG: aminopeptidase P family protein [Candidatus Aminicenantes bacterium]|nr:aminopeptidase P family protein [Candidatus Aminicenantes bacterium]